MMHHHFSLFHCLTLACCCFPFFCTSHRCRSVAQERSLLTGEVGMVTIKMMGSVGKLDGFNSAARFLGQVSRRSMADQHWLCCVLALALALGGGV
jgi:hypothetical protein